MQNSHAVYFDGVLPSTKLATRKQRLQKTMKHLDEAKESFKTGKGFGKNTPEPPFLVPSVIESIKKTNRCVTVEEGWPVSSIGSYVASEITMQAFDYLDAPAIKVSGRDVPMPYAANLEKLALPNVAEVIEAVKAVTYRT